MYYIYTSGSNKSVPLKTALADIYYGWNMADQPWRPRVRREDKSMHGSYDS